ncbi:hypothetical protein [Porphyromonas macacae]|uniref:TonB-dependent receptor n=1 Tax=Porphyromonas macacae TaxID=28115 RepID=A0A379DJF3_9PORP|nr:hypothetical protein [Porphyromonas macacae]SUB78510.1 Uncharacterised protein [Porphyromonas macacae]
MVIAGEVVQKNGTEKVAGAILYLIDAKSNKSISIAQSEDDGSFVFKSSKQPEQDQELVLRAILLGYKPLKQVVKYSNGMVLRLEMEATSFELREVKIKAPAIRELGDTVIYRTSAFAQKQDMTLAQVLERMPGLEIGNGGLIKYEGKPINKFYIEQMDLLGRRYSMASNSLRPEDVAAVEIYRNHEPLRMLEDQSLSDRAALNIKLTKRAKGRILAWAWLSAGVGEDPFLYDLNGRIMRFNSTSQGLYLIKANDTGKDVIEEIRAHELSMSRKLVFSMSDYASPDFYQSMGEALKGSPIGKRQRFNHSCVLSGNQLLKLGDHRFLRINALYSDERFNSSKQETIDYTLPDGHSHTLTGEQDYESRERRMVIEGDYEHNGDRSYFDNKTKLEYKSGNSIDQLRQDHAAYEQKLSLPYLKIENSTTYLFRLGKRLIKLDNKAKYLSRNQTINTSFHRNQSIKSSLLDNSLLLGANRVLGKHQLDNTLQWDLQYHNIGVESSWLLQKPEQLSEYLSNSIRWSPQYNWKIGNWYLMAELPVTYYAYKYQHKNENFVKAELYLRGSKYWANNLKADGSYRFYHHISGASSQLPGLKIIDSRRLTELLPNPYQGNTHTGTLNLSYTVPTSGTAINASTTLSNSKRAYTSSSELQDGYIVFKQIERPSISTRWSNSIRVSQTFWQGKLDASIKGLYNRSRSETYIQKEEIDLISHNYSVWTDLSLRITPDIKLDYSGSLMENRSNSTEGRTLILPKLLMQKHKGTLLVWLSNKWSATATAEHHHTSEKKRGSSSNVTFLDLGFKYHGKKVGIDLLVSNITNQMNYEAITINEPHTSIVTTPLRPFEVLLTFTLKQ